MTVKNKRPDSLVVKKRTSCLVKSEGMQIKGFDDDDSCGVGRVDKLFHASSWPVCKY